MKGLIKGILAIGTAIAVGCVIYKKVKENKEKVESKEEVIIEENQELSEEKQELYNKIVAQVRKEVKPIARVNYIKRFMMAFSIGMFYIFMNYNISVKYKDRKIFESNHKEVDVA